MKRIRESSMAVAMVIGLAIPAEAQQVFSHAGAGAQLTDPNGDYVSASTVTSVEPKTGSSNTLIVHFSNGYYVPSNGSSHEPLKSISAAYSTIAPAQGQVGAWFNAPTTKPSNVGILVGAPETAGQFSLALLEEDWSPAAKTYYVGLKSVGDGAKTAFSPDAKSGATDVDAYPPAIFTVSAGQNGAHFYDIEVMWSSPPEDGGSSESPLPVSKYLVRTTFSQPPVWKTADPKQIYVEVLPVGDAQSFVVTAPHDGFFTVFVQAVDDAGQAGFPAAATVFVGVEEKKADYNGGLETLGCGSSATGSGAVILAGIAVLVALRGRA